MSHDLLFRVLVGYGRTMVVRCLLTCLITLLIGAEAAAATQRFVEPGATGSACTQVDPCALEPTVESAVDGDEVVMGPGTYELGAQRLDISTDTTIRPADPAQKPTISSQNSFVVLASAA